VFPNQIVAEFKHVLGLGTSIMDEFRANLDQVADGIIFKWQRRREQSLLENWMFLNYLKQEFDDDNKPQQVNV